MSKWCTTCHRNEITGEWKSCSEDCPAFGKYFNNLAHIVVSIEAILKEKNGVADSQEFGLSYGQAIGYLEDIEEIMKM